MSEKMKVIAITGERRTEVREVKKPVPGPGQVLMHITACALCTWEQRAYTQVAQMPLPFVGGHEVAGEIAAIGERVDPKEFPIGRKITARLIHVCGKCYFCRNNQENMCVEMNNLDSTDMEIPGTGGLGEYLNVQTSQVYMLPDNLPYERAVFAEPLACVVHSVEQGCVELGDDVVVIGAGIMGMLHVLLAKLKGARVILSEPDEARRRLALELGADIAVNPMETNVVDYVKGITDGRGAEAVFNTTPIASVAEQAVAMTGNNGRCVMYSSMHPDKPIGISPNWLHKSEAVITGSVSPTVRSFFRSVQLIQKGLVNTEKLVSGVYGYSQANEAFEAAIRPDTYRIIIRSDM